MRDYLTFKEELHRRLGEYLPERYQNRRLEINRVPKVNGFVEAINLAPLGGEGISPNLYIADAYEYYLEGGDMEEALKKGAEFLVKGIETGEHHCDRFKSDEYSERIIFCLINREKNRELLAMCPHRNLLDLAIVYRVLSGHSEEELYSALVTNGVAEKLNLTEAELYRRARQGTPKEFPINIKEAAPGFYLLTNEALVFGASAVLYEGALQQLSDKIGGDVYLIPSSIHEFFAVPAEAADARGLQRAISEMNRKVIESGAVLSDRLYRYSAERGKIGFAEMQPGEEEPSEKDEGEGITYPDSKGAGQFS